MFRHIVFVCCLASLTGCPDKPAVTISGSGGGHAGSTSSGGTYAFNAPFLQEDLLRTIVGMAQFPGKKLRPAFMLRIRFQSEPRFDMKTRSTADGERTLWSQRFRAAGDQEVEVRYVMTYSPAAETLTLGGKAYALDAGRLFLLDLRTQPAKITQLASDLGAVIQGEKPGQAELAAAVAALEKQHAVMRELER